MAGAGKEASGAMRIILFLNLGADYRVCQVYENSLCSTLMRFILFYTCVKRVFYKVTIGKPGEIGNLIHFWCKCPLI